MLENAAAFSDDERGVIMAPYFPSLVPAEDGSHLRLAWRMARQTFQIFPWYDSREVGRVTDSEQLQALRDR